MVRRQKSSSDRDRYDEDGFIHSTRSPRGTPEQSRYESRQGTPE